MLSRFTLYLGVLLFALPLSHAHAFDPDDCALWLCMPFGFPEGCEDAHETFIKRQLRGQPPLPRIEQCWFNTDEQFPIDNTTPTLDAKNGFAAYIPEHQQCVRYKAQHDDRICVESITVPPQAIKNRTCTLHDGQYTPKGCTQTISYVDFFMDGQPYQDTYYYDSHGDAIDIPQS